MYVDVEGGGRWELRMEMENERVKRWVLWTFELKNYKQAQDKRGIEEERSKSGSKKTGSWSFCRNGIDLVESPKEKVLCFFSRWSLFMHQSNQ